MPRAARAASAGTATTRNLLYWKKRTTVASWASTKRMSGSARGPSPPRRASAAPAAARARSTPAGRKKSFWAGVARASAAGVYSMPYSKLEKNAAARSSSILASAAGCSSA